MPDKRKREGYQQERFPFVEGLLVAVLIMAFLIAAVIVVLWFVR